MASPRKRTTTENIETSKLFIDSVEEKIYPGNIRRPHGEEGKGYQRDPQRRHGWLEKRAAKFKHALLRTVEVSPRPDGTYALVDGGGRWWMAQIAKCLKLECHVHHGITREEEGKLFQEFDHEIYRLRGIDNFLALRAAEDEVCLAIDEAVKPYGVAVSGRGTLRCVGQFMAIKQTPHGLRVLSSTSGLIARCWGGYNDDAEAFGDVGGSAIDGKLYMAVALVVDAVLETGWPEKVIKQYDTAIATVLHKYTPKKLLAAKNLVDVKTVPAALLIAQKIAEHTRAHISVDNRLTPNMLASGRLFASYSEPRTYSSRMEAEREAALAEELGEEVAA